MAESSTRSDSSPRGSQCRSRITASIVNVRGWGGALGAPTSPRDFAALRVPVLLMVGSDSPASSLGVARLLAKTLPRVEVVEFTGLGHMGPVTHPEVVNERILRFLQPSRPALDPLP